MLSLWSLFKTGLLVTNAVAILHKERFLRPLGWAEPDPALGSSNLKNQAIGLINAVAYLRGPLIAINLLTCTFEMLFGG
ncbi:Yos1-like protein [Tribonema minus]|uniref:Yos1-like protein n=1 Tax=Tribonema minus TaxID=303371 RepID=A0A835YX81_9STRA|nr:Yos1-like protein [Tribonema minus]KAG5183171.1 Yos1-like protein [Tribonema minus]